MLLGVLMPMAACEDETTGGGAQGFDAGTNAFEAGTPPAGDSGVETDAGDDASTKPAVCDDGTVDPGETCDPLASCPTECAPVGCQLRELTGGGTCQAACKDTTLQTVCQNGDGCCPPGCNTTNDNDCAVTCGNGVVEGDETCDPLGKCPTACAALGCQQRTLQGAGTCEAKCVNGALETNCVNGDQCCPAGCNAKTDSDCLPGCGNNVIEQGETCDPLASCPTACPAMGCQLRKLENAGTCAAQCVDDRVQNACINGDGCCPKGCTALNDNDCKPVCGNGTVEPGETCDPPGSCPQRCPGEAYTCFARSGSADTCDVVCHDQAACGTKEDNCCPFGKGGSCGVASDSECRGGEWKWVSGGQVSTVKGCVTMQVDGVVENGSYDITTCAPPGQVTGDGDPQIRNVTDGRNAYAVDNDTCDDALALPRLAGSNCANRKKQLTMACASPSPGGFRAMKGAARFTFDVCSTGVDPGETAVYVWFNAPTEPKVSVVKK